MTEEHKVYTVIGFCPDQGLVSFDTSFRFPRSDVSALQRGESDEIYARCPDGGGCIWGRMVGENLILNCSRCGNVFTETNAPSYLPARPPVYPTLSDEGEEYVQGHLHRLRRHYAEQDPMIPELDGEPASGAVSLGELQNLCRYTRKEGYIKGNKAMDRQNHDSHS